jgi:hypothetical protein
MQEMIGLYTTRTGTRGGYLHYKTVPQKKVNTITWRTVLPSSYGDDRLNEKYRPIDTREREMREWRDWGMLRQNKDLGSVKEMVGQRVKKKYGWGFKGAEEGSEAEAGAGAGEETGARTGAGVGAVAGTATETVAASATRRIQTQTET